LGPDGAFHDVGIDVRKSAMQEDLEGFTALEGISYVSVRGIDFLLIFLGFA
jgi:hypothetical protein